jgi:Concanavalin A-like lectin/glucanases superfamily
MLITTLNIGPMNVPSYIGPGDILGGAYFHVGLRGYNSVSVGYNLINVRRSSDGTNKTFVVLKSGSFNTSDAFFDGSNYFITEAFDTTGNGNHFTQATAANQPGLSLTGGPASNPTITFAQGSSQSLTAAIITTAQPFTWLSGLVYNNTGFQAPAIGDSASPFAQMTFDVSGTFPNQMILYDGGAMGFVAATIADGTYHYNVGVFGGSGANTSFIYSNGVQLANGTSNNGSIAQNLNIGLDSNGPHYFNGNMQDMSMYASAVSSSSVTSLTSNERAFWGF